MNSGLFFPLNMNKTQLIFIWFIVVNRHFGETNMNVRSSRSHTIFRMVGFWCIIWGKGVICLFILFHKIIYNSSLFHLYTRLLKARGGTPMIQVLMPSVSQSWFVFHSPSLCLFMKKKKYMIVSFCIR